MGGRMLPTGSLLAPPILIFWKPNPRHTVLGGDTFRRGLDHENRALISGIGVLMKDPWEVREEFTGKTNTPAPPFTLSHMHIRLCVHTQCPWKLLPYLHHAAMAKLGHLRSRKQSCTRHGIFWNFNLGLLDLQNCM